VIARREAGSHERWPKTLKGELENNSRKPRDPSENWHSDSLKKILLSLSQSKKKRGDEIADDEDSDAVRASVPQDRVTVTLCTEELFLHIQYV
jgi:hypothetical protein